MTKAPTKKRDKPGLSSGDLIVRKPKQIAGWSSEDEEENEKITKLQQQ